MTADDPRPAGALRLPDLPSALAAAGDALVLRNAGLAAAHGWSRDGAVVAAGRGRRPGRTVVGVGPAAAVAALLDDLTPADLLPAPAGTSSTTDGDDSGEGRLTASLPRGTTGLLRRWRPEPVSEWDLLATHVPPAPQPGEDLVRRLTPAEHGEIDVVLDLGNPGSSARSGSAHVRRWVGLRDAAGRLAGCGADTSRTPGLGHLSGITTRPDHRRQGVAAAVTAYLIRELVAEGRQTVCLGMYADNSPARRLYEQLGMTLSAAISTVRLDPY